MESEIKTGEMSEEEIDYNMMGTFPASDPPSWTLGIRLRKKQVTEFEGEKILAIEPSHQNELIALNSLVENMEVKEVILKGRKIMATATQQQNQKTEQGSKNQADRPELKRQTDFEAKRPRQKLEPDSEEYGTELKYRSAANVGTGKFAKGLGYFSIGLGLMELLIPAQVGEMIGASNRYRAFLPVLGVREIAHGVAILSQQKPTEGVWSRVAGDVVDLVYLAAAFAGKENNKNRLTGATIAVLGVTALDVICAQALTTKDWGASINPTAPTTVGQPSARQSQVGSESV